MTCASPNTSSIFVHVPFKKASLVRWHRADCANRWHKLTHLSALCSLWNIRVAGNSIHHIVYATSCVRDFARPTSKGRGFHAPGLRRWPVDAHQPASPHATHQMITRPLTCRLSPAVSNTQQPARAVPVRLISSPITKRGPGSAKPPPSRPCLGPSPTPFPTQDALLSLPLPRLQLIASLLSISPTSAGTINRKRLSQSCLLGPAKLKRLRGVYSLLGPVNRC